jgi:hypothetical protein
MSMPNIELNTVEAPRSPFNASKVALLIENRVNPVLAPLMLHFMSVVPPDWRFHFIGSPESVAYINGSRAIRDAVAIGKMDLSYIPANMSTSSQEEISRFLTTLWLYETLLYPAEWLLIFQTDSMLCANSRQSLDNWLEYDWVGAPWSPGSSFGGNGGLSLRRVSKIIDILKHQTRIPHTEPEDVWLCDRLGHRPDAKMANGTMSLAFSGEMHAGGVQTVSHKKGRQPPLPDLPLAGPLEAGLDEWRDGFYEPMGYHTGSSGDTLHSPIWGTPQMRKHIWDYCPEVKLMLKMDAAQYVPGSCHDYWKRADETEIIDGVEYPLLPAGLAPW